MKDYDAIQAIYHSPLLTALTISDRVQIDYQNASGYELEIHSGLMDICAYLRRPGQQLFEPGRCKQTIARPSIGKIYLFIRCLFISFRSSDCWCDISCHWYCLYR